MRSGPAAFGLWCEIGYLAVGLWEDAMSKSDEKKLEALVRKNAAKAAKAKARQQRKFDPTLASETEEDAERRRFFSDMKKREF